MSKHKKDRMLEDELPDILKAAGKRSPFRTPEGYFDELPERILDAIDSLPDSRRKSNLLYIQSRRWRAVAASVGILLFAGITYALVTKVILPSIHPKDKGAVEKDLRTVNRDISLPDTTALSTDSYGDNLPGKGELLSTDISYPASGTRQFDRRRSPAGSVLPVDVNRPKREPAIPTYNENLKGISHLNWAPLGIKYPFRDTTVCKGNILMYLAEYNPELFDLSWFLDGLSLASDRKTSVVVATSDLSNGIHRLSLIVRDRENMRITSVSNVSITIVDPPQQSRDHAVCGYEKAVIGKGPRNPFWNYYWSTGDQTPEITVTQTGKYWVRVSVRGSGCFITDTFDVTVMPRPEVNLGADRTICAGDKIQFSVKNPEGQYQIRWIPGNSTGQDLRFESNRPGLFRIKVEVTGCSVVADEVMINVSDCSLEIPNVFTPNGDGRNDYFVIKGLESYNANKLVISDRSGRIVFESADYKNNWDGGNLPNGTYYYLLYPGNSNDSYRKGTVMILR